VNPKYYFIGVALIGYLVLGIQQTYPLVHAAAAIVFVGCLPWLIASVRGVPMGICEGGRRGWGTFISGIVAVVLGISGQYVLSGTNSSLALIGMGFFVLSLWLFFQMVHAFTAKPQPGAGSAAHIFFLVYTLVGFAMMGLFRNILVPGFDDSLSNHINTTTTALAPKKEEEKPLTDAEKAQEKQLEGTFHATMPYGKVNTIFSQHFPDGKLVGEFNINPKGGAVVSGTLTQKDLIKDHQVVFLWKDPYGNGFLHATFDKNFNAFKGLHGSEAWNGQRANSIANWDGIKLYEPGSVASPQTTSAPDTQTASVPEQEIGIFHAAIADTPIDEKSINTRADSVATTIAKYGLKRNETLDALKTTLANDPRLPLERVQFQQALQKSLAAHGCKCEVQTGEYADLDFKDAKNTFEVQISHGQAEITKFQPPTDGVKIKERTDKVAKAIAQSGLKSDQSAQLMLKILANDSRFAQDNARIKDALQKSFDQQGVKCTVLSNDAGDIEIKDTKSGDDVLIKNGAVEISGSK